MSSLHVLLFLSSRTPRAAALALRKDLALGLLPTPEAGRDLVPMTIETLHRIGLWRAEDENDPRTGQNSERRSAGIIY